MYAGGNYADYGFVALVNKDTVNPGTFSYLTIAQFDNNGAYTLSYIPNGTYYLLAAVTPNSKYFAGYLPTFYIHTWNWEDAATVVVGNGANSNINIDLVSLLGKKSNGSGCISGTIYNGDYNASNVSTASYIEIVLLDENNNPVAATYSNNAGYYSFSKLAFGSYKVLINYIGLIVPPAAVTLDSEFPCLDNIDFQVDVISLNLFTGIGASIANYHPPSSSISEVYPDPVNDVAYINLSLNPNLNPNPNLLKIDIYNNTGQIVYSKTYGNQQPPSLIQFNTSALKQGMYFVRLSGNDLNVVRRFIKLD